MIKPLASRLICVCTQKNHLDETVLLSTQNMLKPIYKKIFTILLSESFVISIIARPIYMNLVMRFRYLLFFCFIL